MTYNKNTHDDACNFFQKATRKNLMGRFDEARELAQKAIEMLEASDSEDYLEELAGMYFFIGNPVMFGKNTRRAIEKLVEDRRKYAKTSEAYHYGSRYLDAHISLLEKSLEYDDSHFWRVGFANKIVEQIPHIDITSSLIAFDLDGTLLQMKGYSWDYISKMLNIDKKEEERLEVEYRKGNIDYSEWAGKALELYRQKGLNKRHLETLVSKISLVPGAKETIEELKKRGKKVALISGSLDFLANSFFPEGTFDHVHINKLYFDENGNLVSWDATPYGDSRYKMQGLLEICEPKKIISYKRNKNWEKINEEWKDHLNVMYGEWGPDDDGLTKVVTDYPGYQLHRTIYVGDNDNDVEAARSAGMAIAVNARSKKLKSVCEVSVDGDIRGILEFIG